MNPLDYTTDPGFPHTKADSTGAPTNPKLPEVIYVAWHDDFKVLTASVNGMAGEISYTRTDKVQELLLAINNFLADGRPHGGRNTQFPDGCECDLCQNWDRLNREVTKASNLLK